MSFHSNINFFIKLVTVLEIRLGGVTYITRPDFTGKKKHSDRSDRKWSKIAQTQGFWTFGQDLDKVFGQSCHWFCLEMFC